MAAILAGGGGLGPDAGEGGDAFTGDAEVAAGTDEHFFETADVCDGADARRGGAEVEDGIADELSGAVEGDIAAAVGFEQFDAAGGEGFAGEEDVAAVGVAAEGDDGRMFEEKEGVADTVLFAEFDEGLLEVERGGVVGEAEMEEVDQ